MSAPVSRTVGMPDITHLPPADGALVMLEGGWQLNARLSRALIAHVLRLTARAQHLERRCAALLAAQPGEPQALAQDAVTMATHLEKGGAYDAATLATFLYRCARSLSQPRP